VDSLCNYVDDSSNSSKWSENFDERPHHHVVTPRNGKWIRPTLTPNITSLGRS